MPEYFPRIDRSEVADNFIDGCELFTRQIENFIETKDE